MPPSDRLLQVKQLIAQGAVTDALRALNAQTPFRFTALYQFVDPTLKHIYLIDRERSTAEPMADLPIMASYCIFIRTTEQPFQTADAQADVRVQDHPKRTTIRSYCGVPILNEDGTMFGSLCHFDYAALVIPADTLQTLEDVADLLTTRQARAGRSG